MDGPPHELFARMRAEAPVRWNESPLGDFWSLTRHAEVAAVSRDTATFSSYEAGIFLDRDRVNPLEVNRNLLLYKDPPEHTKYRKILQSCFIPHTVRGLEESIRGRVTRVLDAALEKGECDFVADVSVPLPLGVLAELMGIPDEDVPTLARWTGEIEQAQLSPEPAAASETLGEMAPYLQGQIEEQAAAGGESLVTTLREAEVEGESLTDAEILVFFALLVFAGNDTTRNTSSSGLLALLEHPEQEAILRADPAAVEGGVEELLRWTSVVNYFVRTALADTDLAGQAISAGEKVLLWYCSASRDEATYTDPQRFDVTRAEHDHSAFGGGGRHFCLGAGLARLELRVLFEELLRRTASIELTGSPTRLRSSWANSLTSLPVRLTPA